MAIRKTSSRIRSRQAFRGDPRLDKKRKLWVGSRASEANIGMAGGLWYLGPLVEVMRKSILASIRLHQGQMSRQILDLPGESAFPVNCRTVMTRRVQANPDRAYRRGMKLVVVPNDRSGKLSHLISYVIYQGIPGSRFISVLATTQTADGPLGSVGVPAVRSAASAVPTWSPVVARKSRPASSSLLRAGRRPAPRACPGWPGHPPLGPPLDPCDDVRAVDRRGVTGRRALAWTVVAVLSG